MDAKIEGARDNLEEKVGQVTGDQNPEDEARADDAKGQARSAVDEGKDKAADAWDKSKQVGDDAKDKAGEMIEDAVSGDSERD